MRTVAPISRRTPRPADPVLRLGAWLKASGLLVVGVVSMAIGAFVLPGADGTAAVVPTPDPADLLPPVAAPRPADDSPKTAVAPTAVKRPAHPLDAASQIEPRLPSGP